MSNEGKETSRLMHQALRGCMEVVYRTVTGSEKYVYTMRMMLHKAYVVTDRENQKTGLSSTKGFPYVVYGPPELRLVTRFGRWYRNMVDPTAEDHDIGSLVDLIHAQALKEGYVFDTDLTVKVLRGEDIYHAYRKSVGTTSCMSGPDKAWRTWFYVFNPEVVGLATLTNDKARALVWNTEQGHTVLDRIYPNSGPHTLFLKNWALEQGYLIRTNNMASHAEAFLDKNDKRYSPMTVKFNLYHPRRLMPYLDTFCFLESDIEARRLSITDQTPTKHRWIMVDHNDAADPHESVGPLFGVIPDWETSFRAPKKAADTTAGQEHEFPFGLCCQCACTLTEDDHYDVDGDLYCSACYDDAYTACERCGARLIHDDTLCVADEFVCQDCYDHHGCTCSGCHELLWMADAYQASDDDDYFYCEHCVADRRCPECRNVFVTLTKGLCDECRPPA